MPAASIPQYFVLGAKLFVLIVLGFWGRRSFQKLGTALDEQPPGIETSWGGLGGSLGGWSMSKSLAWLLITLLTVVLFAGVALQLSDGLGSWGPVKNEAKSAAPAAEK
jgi:hypothetical protein